MKGSTVTRGENVWLVGVELPPLPDGKRRYKGVSVKGSRRRVEAKPTGLLPESTTGFSAGSADVTVAELLGGWLQHKRDTVRHTTWAVYETIVSRWLETTVAGIPLRKLTTQDVVTALSEM